MYNFSETILGVKVTRAAVQDCVEEIVAGVAAGRKGRVLVCANPHSLVLARRDGAFFDALRDADMVVPDGAGIVLASRILGGGIGARVTGSDVFHGLSRRLNREGGYRCFFLGSTRRNLDSICRKFSTQYPGVDIAGTWSPPFKNEFDAADSRAMISAVNRAAPHVLWVGMTAPKQEKWIHRHRGELEVNFVGAVGAVFDFYIGTVKRSHLWFQERGLEWLPRLLREPRRLWGRTVVSAPKFLLLVLAQRFAQRAPVTDANRR